ncbi:hypothetical protein EYF80_035400 [Liparis tanakae]|uniref:Uncharacterized protein n=1 Tax=Liparis tanakae TaxID=230148 RepID=A0A4Z2GNZ4_9TELE|nr:hypothetical protein EYF80_035400 [Liparis tanakae]
MRFTSLFHGVKRDVEFTEELCDSKKHVTSAERRWRRGVLTCADDLRQAAQPPLVRLPSVVDLGLGVRVQLYVAHPAHRGAAAAAALTALTFGPVHCCRLPLLLLLIFLFYVLLLLCLLTLGRTAAVRPSSWHLTASLRNNKLAASCRFLLALCNTARAPLPVWHLESSSVLRYGANTLHHDRLTLAAAYYDYGIDEKLAAVAALTEALFLPSFGDGASPSPAVPKPKSPTKSQKVRQKHDRLSRPHAGGGASENYSIALESGQWEVQDLMIQGPFVHKGPLASRRRCGDAAPLRRQAGVIWSHLGLEPPQRRSKVI